MWRKGAPTIGGYWWVYFKHSNEPTIVYHDGYIGLGIFGIDSEGSIDPKHIAFTWTSNIPCPPPREVK